MLISTESLKKNINDKCILKDASFTIEDTDKIALIGVNGTGCLLYTSDAADEL